MVDSRLRILVRTLFLIAVSVVFIQCFGGEEDAGGSGGSALQQEGIAAVYFAQTHVKEPGEDHFGLVSDRDTLIKVHVISADQIPSPTVEAVLELDNTTHTIFLDGPADLPLPVDLSLGAVEHTHDDSFTGTIPLAWVRPGLRVTVEAGDDVRVVDNITIGAANLLKLNMFEISAFQQNTSGFAADWDRELAAKLPVSDIDYQLVPDIVFPVITVPPTGSVKAYRVSSAAQYEADSANTFNQHNTTATEWKTALRDAAGSNFGTMAYTSVGWYYHDKNANKGVGGGFSSVSTFGHEGIFLHEAGHGLSLPHWGDNADYPYKGAMHGIDPYPGSYNETHVGPVWGFDMATGVFIPPTVQETSVNGGMSVGTYKKEPMQGGGTGDQEAGFLFRHFSDYSVDKMRGYLESRIVVWNDDLGSYASWNTDTASYSNLKTNNGVQYPVLRDQSIVSVMAGVSRVSANAAANIVYPPIGPYTGGLIDVFDPTNADDKARADTVFCPTDGCDVTLRIVQGVTTKLVMMPISLDESLDQTNAASFRTEAVNLPSSDGTVTRVELLSTPNAEIDGMPASPDVLYTWE